MNLSNIKSDINLLCGSTSASYPDADKIRNINIAYQDVARLIWESSDGWQYDDSNNSTLAIAKATLVHNQQDYSIPSTAQRIHRVEVKQKSGDWLKVSPIDIHDISVAMPAYQSSAGVPLYYDLIGRSIMFYPAPHSASVTLASGVALYVDRDITEFATTATTTEPGFPPAFHRILSYAAAIDFSQDKNQKKEWAAMKARLENGLTRFYSRRNVEAPGTIIPHGKKNWQQYT